MMVRDGYSEFLWTPVTLYIERYKAKFGEEEFAKHLANNAIPVGFENMDYFEFLEARRKLMAGIIKKAYQKLW
jgi:hypothetical protein